MEKMDNDFARVLTVNGRQVLIKRSFGEDSNGNDAYLIEIERVSKQFNARVIETITYSDDIPHAEFEKEWLNKIAEVEAGNHEDI